MYALGSPKEEGNDVDLLVVDLKEWFGLRSLSYSGKLSGFA